MDLVNLIYEIKKDEYSDLRNSSFFKFIGSCISHSYDTKSQNYQDVWALFESGFKRDGFFVDFGATDGLDGSNTYLLEKKYGWKGILAEPNSSWSEKLHANRDCFISDLCVYATSGDTVEFLMTEDPTLSTVKGFEKLDEWVDERAKSKSVHVQTISLYDLLQKYDAPTDIDYLSIDTEGTEFGILNAFFNTNQNRYNIKTITVEHNFTPMRNKLSQLLRDNGYIHKFPELSRWDDFYVKGL